MKINLQVTYSDNRTKELVAVAADLVAFENQFDLSVAKLEREVKLTHLLYIAWSVEKRTKGTALDFDAWVETVESVGIADTPK